MKFVRFLPILFLFIAFKSGQAQEATLRGLITDSETGESLYGANVIADLEAGKATVTGFDGRYSIKLKPGDYKIKVTYLGKEDQFFEVSLSAGEEKTLDINLGAKKELLDVVVVSATKYEAKIDEVTVSLEVMGNELLENNNVIDIEEGLNKVPGVTITDRQINIRGGSGWSYGAGTRVMTLVDDMPILTADAGDVRWSSIPTENINQVEVIKGAASALYGSSALNGIVNIRLAEPNKEPYTKISTYGTVYMPPRNRQSIWWQDSGRVYPHITGFNFAHRRMFGDQVGLVAGGNFINHMNFKARASNTEARVTTNWFFKPRNIKNLKFSLKYNHNFDKGSTYFLWDGIDSLQLLPLPGSASVYFNQRMNVDFTVDYLDKKYNKYVFRSRYFRTVNTNNTNQGNIGNLYFGEFQYQKRIMKEKYQAAITTGVSGYYSDVRPPRGEGADATLVGEHTGFNFSGYLQADFKFFSNTLNLSVGSRYEYFKIDSFASDALPVFRFGLSYQIQEGSNIRLSWGQGYRFPTIAEKFVNTSIGAIGIYPNPNLQPETGWSAEIGFKQKFVNRKQTWFGYADISAFVLRYNNMMEFSFGQFGPLTPPLFGLGFSAQNVGKTFIPGFEFSAFTSGKIGKFPLDIFMGYTYVLPKSLNWDDPLFLIGSNGDTIQETTYSATSSSDENVLKYRSRHNFKIDAQTSYKKFDFGVSVQYVSWQENIDALFVTTAIGLEPQIGTQAFSGLKEWRERFDGRGTTLVDLRVAYHFKELMKVALIAKNILNLEYVQRPAEIEAPASITLQLNWEF